MTERSAGWYADPTGRHEYRYWDSTWTDYVADGGVTTMEPIGAVDTTTDAVPGLPGTKSGHGRLASDPSRAGAVGGAASAHVTSRQQDPEVESARQLMGQFAACMGGDYDVMEQCLVAVGRAGGYRGLEDVFEQVRVTKAPFSTIWDWNEPWRWLSRVSSRAYEERVGDEFLPAQILLFALIFTQELAPQLERGNFAEFGFFPPSSGIYTEIATRAKESLSGIPDEVPVMQTPTEVVDAGMTRQFCDHVLRAAT